MKIPGHARRTFLKMFHLSAPFYFLWLDYHTLGTARKVVVNKWDHIGFPIVMLGIHLFTIWGQILQQTYFVTIAWKEVASILKINKRTEFGESTDYMGHFFPSVVFPISLVVVFNFWAVYTVDPLLLDDLGVIEHFVPTWLNHCLHTNILVIALVEAVMNSELKFCKNDWSSAAAVILIYSVTVKMLATVCPRCVYPMFKDAAPWRHVLYLLGNCAIVIAAYEAEKRLHWKIWGKERKTS